MRKYLAIIILVLCSVSSFAFMDSIMSALSSKEEKAQLYAQIYKDILYDKVVTYQGEVLTTKDIIENLSEGVLIYDGYKSRVVNAEVSLKTDDPKELRTATTKIYEHMKTNYSIFNIDGMGDVYDYDALVNGIEFASWRRITATYFAKEYLGAMQQEVVNADAEDQTKLQKLTQEYIRQNGDVPATIEMNGNNGNVVFNNGVIIFRVPFTLEHKLTETRYTYNVDLNDVRFSLSVLPEFSYEAFPYVNTSLIIRKYGLKMDVKNPITPDDFKFKEDIPVAENYDPFKQAVVNIRYVLGQ